MAEAGFHSLSSIIELLRFVVFCTPYHVRVLCPQPGIWGVPSTLPACAKACAPGLSVGFPIHQVSTHNQFPFSALLSFKEGGREAWDCEMSLWVSYRVPER